MVKEKCHRHRLTHHQPSCFLFPAGSYLSSLQSTEEHWAMGPIHWNTLRLTRDQCSLECQELCLLKEKKISHNCILLFVWLLSRTFNQSFHSKNSERNWIRFLGVEPRFLNWHRISSHWFGLIGVPSLCVHLITEHTRLLNHYLHAPFPPAHVSHSQPCEFAWNHWPGLLPLYYRCLCCCSINTMLC